MRIALVTETFLPATDGIVTRLTHTIRNLTQKGHEVRVFAPAGSVSTFSGVEVTSLPGFPYPFYPEKRFAWPLPALVKPLLDAKPDVIHAAGPIVLGMGAVLIAKRCHIPLVASYHTHLAVYAKRYNVPFLGPVSWFYLRNLHNLADVSLATSHAMVRELREHGFRRMRYWPRGLDHAAFQPQDTPEKKRAWSLRDDRFTLLYVGRIAHEKDLRTILEPMKLLPEAHLILVGDGPARAELTVDYASANVTFAGPLYGRDLAEAYASADLFVFPSVTETLGLVVMEAMASGLPVLAVKSEPTLELLKGERNGTWFDGADPSTFIAQVRALSQDVDRLTEMTAFGVLRAQRWNWDHATDELIRTYDAAIRLAKWKRARPERRMGGEPVCVE